MSVWLNKGQKGDYYQVAPQRAFNGGGELKNSASFAEGDVPLLSRLFDEAYEWMRMQPPGKGGGRLRSVDFQLEVDGGVAARFIVGHDHPASVEDAIYGNHLPLSVE